MNIRKVPPIITLILMLCLALPPAGFSEMPDIDLSVFSLEELDELKTEINAEKKLHHETNSKTEEEVLKTVKSFTEQYYTVLLRLLKMEKRIVFQ